MADTVKDVMTAELKTVEASATLKEAAEIMAQADIGDVLVVENNEVKGIVTDRDITVRGVAEGKDVEDCSVREVATTDIATLSPDDSVEDAIKLMQEKDVRRLPVVDGDEPVGIVSLGDLAESQDTDSVLADISSAQPNN